MDPTTSLRLQHLSGVAHLLAPLSPSLAASALASQRLLAFSSSVPLDRLLNPSGTTCAFCGGVLKVRVRKEGVKGTCGVCGKVRVEQAEQGREEEKSKFEQVRKRRRATKTEDRANKACVSDPNLTAPNHSPVIGLSASAAPVSRGSPTPGETTELVKRKRDKKKRSGLSEALARKKAESLAGGGSTAGSGLALGDFLRGM